MSWHTSNQEMRPVTAREYHLIGADVKRGDPAKIMSRSELVRCGVNQHKWLLGAKDETNGAMRFGDRVDCLWLRPDEFADSFAIAPASCLDSKGVEKPWDYKSEARRAWRDEQLAAGKQVTTEEELSEVRKVVERLDADKEAAEIKAVSRAQLLALAEWHDEDTGLVIPFKAFIDLVPDPASQYGSILVDLKTCANAEYRAWTKAIYKQQYHYQAAIYIDIVNAAEGLEYSGFKHIIVESEPPAYEMTVRPLSPEFILIGRAHYQSDLRTYCRALKTGFFRGYDRAEVVPEQWML